MVQEVKYEIAKLLAEKGFPQNNIDYVTISTMGKDENDDFIFGNTYSCPTIAQVIMWLCEKQIDLCHIVNYKNNVRKYRMGIVYIKNNVIESTFIKDENTLDFLEFDSLTEAYMEAINYTLNNLI